MRTLRFSRRRGHYLFITDDGFIVHARHHDYDRSHGGAFATHETWRWTEIDRFEFFRLPDHAQYRRHWVYELYAVPTDECRRTLSRERPPLNRGKLDPRHSLRVWRLSQVRTYRNDRSLSTTRWEGAPSGWVVWGSDSFRRWQWRGIARAIRKRAQGRLTLDTSVLYQRRRRPKPGSAH